MIDPMERRTPVNSHPAVGGLVPSRSVPSQKCRATNRKGEPCGRWAIVGGTVCPMHGGKAPQTVAARDRRIRSLQPLALQVLDQALTDPEVPWSQKVRAAAIVVEHTEPKAPELHLHEHQGAENPALDEAILNVLRARGQVVDVEAHELPDDLDDQDPGTPGPHTPEP